MKNWENRSSAPYKGGTKLLVDDEALLWNLSVIPLMIPLVLPLVPFVIPPAMLLAMRLGVLLIYPLENPFVTPLLGVLIELKGVDIPVPASLASAVAATSKK